jgi:hypothetical protein
VIGQARESVEGDTIHRYKGRGGKQRLLVEKNPVDAMVIGHGLLNYPTPL